MAQNLQGLKKSEKQNTQELYKAHYAFDAENSDFMRMALDAVNSWGRGEATLAHAVGLALKEAWEMGAEGRSPEIQKAPVTTFVRRSKPAPAPVRTSMVRRSR